MNMHASVDVTVELNYNILNQKTEINFSGALIFFCFPYQFRQIQTRAWQSQFHIDLNNHKN